MLKIDGSYGEGGGQILRTALVISLLTQTPFHMVNIRKGRDKPGLKAQHLHILEALQEITDSRIEGATPGSETLLFIPGNIHGGSARINIGTAGAIPLLLQTLLPVGLFARDTLQLEITGGTDVKGSMTIDYYQHILLDRLRTYAWIDLEVLCRGYFPKGGGQVKVKASPCTPRTNYPNFHTWRKALTQRVNKIELVKQGRLSSIKLISTCSELLRKRDVARRQLKTCRSRLEHLGVPIQEQIIFSPSLSPSCSLTAIADYSSGARLGADGLGEPGKPAEKVGQEVADKLILEIQSNAAVDRHAADNLIPLLALTGGCISVSSLTPHTRTNIWITEQFLGNIFYIEEGFIRCTGA
jgi:RNA 3'-phosphate cyclase